MRALGMGRAWGMGMGMGIDIGHGTWVWGREARSPRFVLGRPGQGGEAARRACKRAGTVVRVAGCELVRMRLPTGWCKIRRLAAGIPQPIRSRFQGIGIDLLF